MTIESICFETEWNDKTLFLKDPESTTTQKLKNFALNIFHFILFPIGMVRLANYGMGCLANRVTLPAAYCISKRRFSAEYKEFDHFWYGPITEKNKLIRESYTLVQQKVMTPDKMSLEALCMKHRDSTSETPTLIYFNGNFQLCIETPIDWLLEEFIHSEVPCNLVLFDYRGVGKSTGNFSQAKDLIVDGFSIIEWVEKKIGTDPSLIHIYGFSLGGAIASIIKGIDPEHLTGKMINDRSFSSSSQMFRSFYGSGYVGRFMDWCFHQNGYGSDPAASFQKASGEKLVIYHPNDEVIPMEASMQYAVQHGHHIRLEVKPEFEREAREWPPHIAPLIWHESAVARVIEFLLPHSASLSARVV